MNHRYGPWALVTGASDGIGRELAGQIAARGTNVVLVARTESALLAEAAELQAAHGIQTMVVAGDLADPHAVERVEELTGGLDVGLVVLAAGFGTTGSVLETALADEMALIAVNVAAVTRLAHTFAGRLTRRGSGGLILFGSIVGWQGCRDRPTMRRRRRTCRASPRHCTTNCDRTASTCWPSLPARSRPGSAPGQAWR